MIHTTKHSIGMVPYHLLLPRSSFELHHLLPPAKWYRETAGVTSAVCSVCASSRNAACSTSPAGRASRSSWGVGVECAEGARGALGLQVAVSRAGISPGQVVRTAFCYLYLQTCELAKPSSSCSD
jgi:hypothetical protein